MKLIVEKNVPTDPAKWSYYKSQAKKKFDVYPSAYANGWAAKQYKAAGGGWKTEESVDEAKQNLGFEVGDFVHTFGDTHIYLNHFEQVKLQLSREPMPLPKLKLNKEIKNIEDFKFEDIEILNYNSHPPIKGKISI